MSWITGAGRIWSTPCPSSRHRSGTGGPRSHRGTHRLSEDGDMWPTDAKALIELQRELARAEPEPWRPAPGELRIGGCWVCFPRGISGRGEVGDVAWAAAVVMRGGVLLDAQVRRGVAGAPYSPGLLALRIG